MENQITCKGCHKPFDSDGLVFCNSCREQMNRYSDILEMESDTRLAQWEVSQ